MTQEIRNQIRSRIAAGEAGQWDAAVLWQEVERLEKDALPAAACVPPALQEAAFRLGSLSFRMKTRIDTIVKRDGPVAVVTGPGIGIGYLFARQIHEALRDGSQMLESLAQGSSAGEPPQATPLQFGQTMGGNRHD